MSAAIEELLRAYCAAIDARTDPNGVAARFWTEDGVIDNSAIGIPTVAGRSALAADFAQMFAGMEMLDHRISDVRTDEKDEGSAQATATVNAKGRPVGGESFEMTGTYRLEARRTGDGWKIARLVFTPAV